MKLSNKMSEIVRETVVDIARNAGIFPVLKADGSDEFVKNLMFKMPHNPHFLFIRKDGISTNSVGMPTYFQVAVHPEFFRPEFIEPNHGIDELINCRTKQNLFSSSNYRGFPNYSSNKEPCGKCYEVSNFSALERLFNNFVGKSTKKSLTEILQTTEIFLAPDDQKIESFSKFDQLREISSLVSDNNEITTALIIDTPYIDRILSGEKTWEMRSKNCSIRGTVGLIRKGSGQVIGVVDVVDCTGPLSADDILKNQDKHRISLERLKNPEIAKWNTAWVMANPRKLPVPVTYNHPNGAVIWIKLKDEVQHAIAKQL